MLPHDTYVMANPVATATARAKENFMIRSIGQQIHKLWQRFVASETPKIYLFMCEVVEGMEVTLRCCPSNRSNSCFYFEIDDGIICGDSTNLSRFIRIEINDSLSRSTTFTGSPGVMIFHSSGCWRYWNRFDGGMACSIQKMVESRCVSPAALRPPTAHFCSEEDILFSFDTSCRGTVFNVDMVSEKWSQHKI